MGAGFDDAREALRFRRRLKMLGMVACACLGLLMVRVVWLQVVRHDDYAALAEQNRAAVQPAKSAAASNGK